MRWTTLTAMRKAQEMADSGTIRLGKKPGLPRTKFLACCVIGLTSFIIISALGRPCWAALLAYEGFEYEEIGEQLLRKDGGFGFTGRWGPGSGTGSTPLTITEGSLSYDGLSTSGNRLHVESGGGWNALLRTLTSDIGVRDTGTRYVSFLIRPEHGSTRAERPIGWGALGLLGVFDGNAPWAGYTGSRYAMSEWVGRSETKTSEVAADLDETAFFVVPGRHDAGSGFLYILC